MLVVSMSNGHKRHVSLVQSKSAYDTTSLIIPSGFPELSPLPLKSKTLRFKLICLNILHHLNRMYATSVLKHQRVHIV